MNKSLLLMLLLCLFVSNEAKAQYTVFDDAKGELINVYNDVNIDKSVFLEAHSDAELKYLKKVKRNEKNFLETKNSLYFTQYAYSNWAEGGENSITGKATSKTKHIYTNNKITVTSYLNAAYALNYQGSAKQKKEDAFELNTELSYLIWGKWSCSFGLNLKSQFTRTYNADRTDYQSTFFAPGNLKPYAGFLYTFSKKRTIMISPLSADMLFVLDNKLSQAGSFGITPGKKFQANVGIFLNVQWEENLTKDGSLTYKTNLQSFYDYKGVPNLSWENWVDYSLLKYFSINFYVKAIYDKKINANNPWQIKESFGIGLSYNFKNK